MQRFGSGVCDLARNEKGSIPLVTSLMVALVLFAQGIIFAAAIGSGWLRLKHEATEASKRAAFAYLQGQDGCLAVTNVRKNSCAFDGQVVQVEIREEIRFWFLKNELMASSRAGLNFPTP